MTSFGINAIGQRTVKAGATAALTTRFVYGEDGKLLGEYDNAGTLITEHVYLNDTPIAAIKSAGAYVVQADHLNTPRAILGAGNVSAWTWDSDAFGTTAANEKPSTLATFNYNLRFPGQYYDKETLTHYNYFRDYNPKTGRYIESDPIGLKGGINTFAYVDNNPLRWRDPLGLAKSSVDAAIEQAVIRGDITELQTLLENVANLEKSKVEALLAQCAKNTTKDVGKMASRFGKSPKEIRQAIEKIKQDNLPRGGPNRNPDVRIDSRGNAYPETANGVGDTIGNIFDYLQ